MGNQVCMEVTGCGDGCVGMSIVYLGVWVGGQLHFGQGHIFYANTYFITPT